MSASSDSGPVRRVKQHHDHADGQEQTEVKRVSRYDIYGSDTKPFGESYRRSRVQEREQEPEQEQEQEQYQEREDSPLDADSVEEAMGCNESRPQVATNQETVKGSFKEGEVRENGGPKVVFELRVRELQECEGPPGGGTIEGTAKDEKEETGETVWERSKSKGSSGKLSDYEIVYGTKKEGSSDYVVDDRTYVRGKPTKKSDYEIIYGKKKEDYEIIYGKKKEDPIPNGHCKPAEDDPTPEGRCKVAIYSEVRKPERTLAEPEMSRENGEESEPQTPRDMLMQQIRERKDEGKPKEDVRLINDNASEVLGEEECKDRSIRCKEEIFSIPLTNHEQRIMSSFANATPVTFLEEEYSYEPENKEATSKLVLRSRSTSLANLDQTQATVPQTMCTLKRPNTLKMTTKPDGTIRYGLKRGSSESDLLDEPQPSIEAKNNYVNSIKSAFDAAIEQHQQEKTGKAEAFDGLRQYFHDNKQGLQELLVNNNVVIIEPYRPDPPSSPGSEKSETGSQRTCRITGATVKSPVTDQKKIIPISNTLPRANKSREGFYHPIRVNKELIDAELPDPDKVKSARELFENVLKSKSTTEIPSKKPQSKSFFNTLTSKMKMRITPEVKVIQGSTYGEKKKQGRLTIDQMMREDVRRFAPHRRWTDSGSLSSGVSSDFSCDQDCDFQRIDSPAGQDILEEYSSDEAEYNYPYDTDEGHPVSTEVLQKIRACGTTVTYYGGKVIARSHGQARSPMTMTIMDEIRQSSGGRHPEAGREQPYLGVKFRLVKSHSCGSRLEITGTDEDRPRHDGLQNESIAEEKERAEAEAEGEEDELAESDKVEADRYDEADADATSPRPVMTWAELKLKEATKQWYCAPEAVRAPPQDMEFETFEVLDESAAHGCDKPETTRG